MTATKCSFILMFSLCGWYGVGVREGLCAFVYVGTCACVEATSQ